MTGAEALIAWAKAQAVTVTTAPAELAREYRRMAEGCKVTHSGRLAGRDERRIIADLRHRHTNYESCLHALTEECLRCGIDAQSWQAEKVHEIIRWAANDAVRDALVRGAVKRSPQRTRKDTRMAIIRRRKIDMQGGSPGSVAALNCAMLAIS